MLTLLPALPLSDKGLQQQITAYNNHTVLVSKWKGRYIKKFVTVNTNIIITYKIHVDMHQILYTMLLWNILYHINHIHWYVLKRSWKYSCFLKLTSQNSWLPPQSLIWPLVLSGSPTLTLSLDLPLQYLLLGFFLICAASVMSLAYSETKPVLRVNYLHYCYQRSSQTMTVW